MSCYIFHCLTLPLTLLARPEKSSRCCEGRGVPAVRQTYSHSHTRAHKHTHTHTHYNPMWQGAYSTCLTTGTACPSNAHTELKANTAAAMRCVTLSIGRLLCQCPRVDALTLGCVCLLSASPLWSNQPNRVLSVNTWAVKAFASLLCHSHSYLFSHSTGQGGNEWSDFNTSKTETYESQWCFNVSVEPAHWKTPEIWHNHL